MKPLETLLHHITGAIERGEAKAIAGVPLKYLIPVKSPIGAVWFYCDSPEHFDELAALGFKPGKRNGLDAVEACVMSGAVHRAESAGFELKGKGDA